MTISQTRFMEIDETDLASIVLTGNGTVIVDCRCFSDYNHLHVRNAVNAFYSKLMRKRIMANKVDSVTLLGQILGATTLEDRLQNMMDLVLYADEHETPTMPTRTTHKRRCDAGKTGTESAAKVIRLLKEKLEQTSAFNNIMLLRGGFDTFKDRFPELCESSTLSAMSCRPSLSQPCRTPSQDGPTQILPFLFLGSQHDALNNETLKAHGIKYVLNLSQNCPKSDILESDEHFMRIPVNDNYQEKLLPHFDKAFEYLEHVRKSQSVVLIHCLAGISRSPTLAIAYIMRHLKITSDEAYRLVKKKRPSISPNFNFMGQLLEYEKQLRDADILPQKKVEYPSFAHDKQDFCPAKVPKSASSLALLCGTGPGIEESQPPNENGKRVMAPVPDRPVSMPTVPDRPCSLIGEGSKAPCRPAALGLKARKPLCIPSAVAEDLPSPSSEFEKLTFAGSVSSACHNPCFVTPQVPSKAANNESVHSSSAFTLAENPMFDRLHSRPSSLSSTGQSCSLTSTSSTSSDTTALTTSIPEDPIQAPAPCRPQQLISGGSRIINFFNMFRKTAPLSTMVKSATVAGGFSSRPDCLSEAGLAREQSAPAAAAPQSSTSQETDSPESGYQEEYKTSPEQEPDRTSIGSGSSVEIAVQ